MSKETYLKGEEKLKAITIIKTGLGVRMRPAEILSQLSGKGIEIGERTLRRLKLEIYENGGDSIMDIYKNLIGGSLLDQILSFEEMERQCWKLYFQTKLPHEKLRALSQLRIISQDKMKLNKHFTMGSRNSKIDYTQIKDDLREFHEEDDSTPPES